MYFRWKARQSGFTLVEVIVIVGIIALLCALAVPAVLNAQRLARNAKRIVDIRQYVFAFEEYFKANNSYPYLGGPNRIRCLGDYPDDFCWENNNRPDSPELISALRPYFPQLPAGDTAGRWEGYVYGHNVNLIPVFRYIEWFLEGIGQDCGPGKMLSPNYGTPRSGCTYCRYTFSE